MSSTLERDNVQAVNHLVHRVIRGALPRFSGVRGIEIPRNRFFSCTVNGTFSFWRDKKRMWGWNCGFRKMPRYDWQRAVRTKYVKRISALRTNLFCRSLRRGTFHRRKVPKTAGAFRCAPDPWRLLKRRRAACPVHFDKQKQIAKFFPNTTKTAPFRVRFAVF